MIVVGKLKGKVESCKGIELEAIVNEKTLKVDYARSSHEGALCTALMCGSETQVYAGQNR